MTASASMPDSSCLISVSGVSKEFRQRRSSFTALDHIDLSIPEGQFVTLLGPSGCGKSTLLRIIAGLTGATTGKVSVAGKTVSGPSRRVGMMFQAPVLLPWRSVKKNVLLPAEIAGSSQAHRSRVNELLQMVGLSEFATRLPHELSGGMQQRVALCRTLLTDPVALLMDEPFGALDALTREQMALALLQIWEATQKTVLFVTHSIPEALLLGDRVIVMSPVPGRIIADLAVPLPRPRTFDMEADPTFQRTAGKLRSLLGVADRARQEARL